MPNEILINYAGLFRCCLVTVSAYSENFPVWQGNIFQCPHCGEQMELVEEGENLCWQKLEVKNDANTVSN